MYLWTIIWEIYILTGFVKAHLYPSLKILWILTSINLGEQILLYYLLS